MRHRKSGRKLNRPSSHRKSLFKNLSIALIEQELIKTTVQKAKELRRFIEPLITRAKVDSVANRRLIFSKLRHDASLTKLFDTLGPRYLNRSGGYTRVIKAGYRYGDSAPMALIEMVSKNEDSSPEEEAGSEQSA